MPEVRYRYRESELQGAFTMLEYLEQPFMDDDNASDADVQDSGGGRLMGGAQFEPEGSSNVSIDTEDEDSA